MNKPVWQWLKALLPEVSGSWWDVYPDLQSSFAGSIRDGKS